MALPRPWRPRSARPPCSSCPAPGSAASTTNANLKIDPEQRAIAQYQASRTALPRGRAGTIAYRDVPDASTCAGTTGGRGVVLIGHSQGTYMLRELIRGEIDRKPAVRRRLVSGLLLGGNVEVREGSDRGGDFRNVPACRSSTQLGCVIAYSMFDKEPANPSRFARTDAPGREVLCANPASLSGGSGSLDAYSRTTPFPGTLGVAVGASTDLPKVGSPWVAFPRRATARCVKRGGASWLQIDAVEGDPRPTFRAVIGDDWGLHLGDVNIA